MYGTALMHSSYHMIHMITGVLGTLERKELPIGVKAYCLPCCVSKDLGLSNLEKSCKYSRICVDVAAVTAMLLFERSSQITVAKYPQGFPTKCEQIHQDNANTECWGDRLFTCVGTVPRLKYSVGVSLCSCLPFSLPSAKATPDREASRLRLRPSDSRILAR